MTDMSTWSQTEDLVLWLREMRQKNAMQLEIMALHFDLEGALSSGQLELAWYTREGMLMSGVELYLLDLGLTPRATPDRAERTGLMLVLLHRVNAALADAVGKLLDTPAPETTELVAPECEAVREFLRRELSVDSAISRSEATRAWAQGVKVLREVAKGLGLAQADNWYLSDSEDGLENQLDWYDQVMSLL